MAQQTLQAPKRPAGTANDKYYPLG